MDFLEYMKTHLPTLCSIDGVSSDEERVRGFIKSMANIETFTDKTGNLYIGKKGTNPKGKKIMVCAHMDEVGFIVKKITDDGYIKFGCVGGIDERVLVGKRVRFKNASGVIGIKAVHLTTKEERSKVKKVEDLYIDIGAKTKEEAQNVVKLGELGTFDSGFEFFGDGFICSKAIDNRFGVLVMLKLLQQDFEEDIYFVFTSMEEVGLKGATVASSKIKPDYALVIETTTAADIPEVEGANRVCLLGGGAVVPFMDRATIYDRELFEMTRRLAEENKIKWQTKTVVAGGNDSGAISTSSEGVKTICVSAPVRYIHTPSVMMKMDDGVCVYNLCEKILRELSK